MQKRKVRHFKELEHLSEVSAWIWCIKHCCCYTSR